MGKFLKAMEAASRERARLEESRRQNGGSSPVDLGAQLLLELDKTADAPATPAQPPASPTNGHRKAEGEGAREGTAPTPVRAAARPEPTPELREKLDDHLVSLMRPMSFEAEQYRALRLMIEQRHAALGLSVVAVCSPGTGDGKTTTAINLAGALAQDPEARVLLVDADLRHSSVASRLGLGDEYPPGLAEAVLDSSLSLEGLVLRYPAFNLDVLTAGEPQSRPYELFGSPRLGERLAAARRLYDYVVVDTPPLLPVPDSRVLAHWVDGVLIVVAAHKTPHRMLEEALTQSGPEKLLALVFNGDNEPLASYYSGYYSSPPSGQDRPRR
jgi:capsular exopolysaccharide synthesis family protein